MRRLLTSVMFWLVISTTVVGFSIRADLGSAAWSWFQRSGTILIVAGAFLSYRSIVRLGVAGVGGANTTLAIGKVISADDSGPAQTLRVVYDDETREHFRQAAHDKVAGILGAFLILLGSAVSGYGDLAGRLLLGK